MKEIRKIVRKMRPFQANERVRIYAKYICMKPMSGTILRFIDGQTAEVKTDSNQIIRVFPEQLKRLVKRKKKKFCDYCGEPCE